MVLVAFATHPHGIAIYHSIQAKTFNLSVFAQFALGQQHIPFHFLLSGNFMCQSICIEI
jgi:hypothetical protein